MAKRSKKKHSMICRFENHTSSIRAQRINKWTTQKDLKLPVSRTYDWYGKLIGTQEQVATILAKAGEHADKEWLWCLYCGRFFRAKDLKLDFMGNWQRCPFDDCQAAGFNVAILPWDDGKFADPDWPKSVQKLSFGLEYPPRYPLARTIEMT